MKVRSCCVASMICLAIASCPVCGAWAAKSLTIAAFGGYQTYDMADVNEAMQSTLSSYPGSRADKKEIESGAGFGGGIRIWTSERVFVSLDFQRLLASNSGSGPYCWRQHRFSFFFTLWLRPARRAWKGRAEPSRC